MIFYRKDVGGRMMEKEPLCPLKYCPRCGSIEGHFRSRCAICGWHEVFIPDPKWNITDDVFLEICRIYCQDSSDMYIRYEKVDEQWEEHCRPFKEAVVMTGPYFSPDAYKLYIERAYPRKSKEVRQKYVDTMLETYKKIHSVECPFCGSTNTKKIPHVLRMFGLSSKWWRCKNCKSMW